jgi:ribosome-associated translation inhibitor RaiA
MKFTIRNNADLSNRYIRFLKWKSYILLQKFKQLQYLDVYITSEGNPLPLYKVVLKIGVSGHDLILSKKDYDLKLLFKKCAADMERYLRKHKEKNIEIKRNLNRKKVLIARK